MNLINGELIQLILTDEDALKVIEQVPSAIHVGTNVYVPVDCGNLLPQSILEQEKVFECLMVELRKGYDVLVEDDGASDSVLMYFNCLPPKLQEFAQLMCHAEMVYLIR